ncbi:hypothetical protein BU26DRAFT_503425 [Trematosphaeria pertusa]|uniref:Protein kinase domain-containing protein n=1 Tax=Trematosphaeria pertusa TaxID=390896 RepID=A0A6A6IKQ8_9PLEO|nr:uncharacterized protein BU26DRAFT_503425 [Trematosphaeria pertusa]KAF2250799.1 hypothetical protein BU26DRAFT_503425 [Trematosphaeria pertusa]
MSTAERRSYAEIVEKYICVQVYSPRVDVRIPRTDAQDWVDKNPEPEIDRYGDLESKLVIVKYAKGGHNARELRTKAEMANEVNCLRIIGKEDGTGGRFPIILDAGHMINTDRGQICMWFAASHFKPNLTLKDLKTYYPSKTRKSIPIEFVAHLYLELRSIDDFLANTCGITAVNIHEENILVCPFPKYKYDVLPRIRLINFGEAKIHGQQEGRTSCLKEICTEVFGLLGLEYEDADAKDYFPDYDDFKAELERVTHSPSNPDDTCELWSQFDEAARRCLDDRKEETVLDIHNETTEAAINQKRYVLYWDIGAAIENFRSGNCPTELDSDVED